MVLARRAPVTAVLARLSAPEAAASAWGGRVFAVQYEDGIDGPARVWLAKIDIQGLPCHVHLVTQWHTLWEFRPCPKS